MLLSYALRFLSITVPRPSSKSVVGSVVSGILPPRRTGFPVPKIPSFGSPKNIRLFVILYKGDVVMTREELILAMLIIGLGVVTILFTFLSG